MNIPPDLVLWLTASVNPNGMPGVTRPDPHAREQDYVDCLKFYSQSFPEIQRIVFAENSGWPLDRLQAASQEFNPHRKEFEFVSLQCNDFPRHLGKSYGEMLLMEQSFDRSPMLRHASFIAKLTGRNYLMNLTRILQKTRRPFEMMCDLRDHGLYELLRLTWNGRHADTRFIVMTPRFFETRFRGAYQTLDESKGILIEDLFYKVAKDPANRDVVIRRLPIEPVYRGMAGHLHKDYGGWRERLKCRVRGMGRVIVPWFHF
jgi:hypothetical protein